MLCYQFLLIIYNALRELQIFFLIAATKIMFLTIQSFFSQLNFKSNTKISNLYTFYLAKTLVLLKKNILNIKKLIKFYKILYKLHSPVIEIVTDC